MQTIAEQTPDGIDFDVRSPFQRRERRHPIPRGMKLQVRTSQQQEFVEAELHDISRNGVGFLSPRLLTPGASISFPFGSQQRIFAQVRHCHPNGTSFVVGALILEVVAEQRRDLPDVERLTAGFTRHSLKMCPGLG
jgi:hypothetical protein